jgi:hypothetical protein
MPGGKLDDEIAVLIYEGIGNANDSTAAFTRPRVKKGRPSAPQHAVFACAAARAPRLAMPSKQKFL